MLLQNILRLCRERGISVAKLERLCGFGNGTIRKWGSASPSVDNALKAARVLGVTVEALMETDGPCKVIEA